jgi:aspartate 1-decarboxylase
VTEAKIDYMGSITIDEEILQSANIKPYEKVQVVDVTNGARLETYVLPGEKGSGEICINGAAARLVHKGDEIIVLSYIFLEEGESEKISPLVVYVDAQNKIVEVKEYKKHFDIC